MHTAPTPPVSHTSSTLMPPNLTYGSTPSLSLHQPLICIDETDTVKRASGNGQGFLFATRERGEVMGAIGSVLPRAWQEVDEERRWPRKLEPRPMVEQLDQMIAPCAPGSK